LAMVSDAAIRGACAGRSQSLPLAAKFAALLTRR
jgi:hypothetical protein